jgi:gamma-glutamyltranspeptidase/glutathione hydrolase
MRTLLLTLGTLLAFSSSTPAADPIGWHASGKGGAVAAGHEDAVAAGIGVLQDGGNAADAAATALLALAVTDYGNFAFGGEVSLLIYDAQGKEVKVLCGQGRAPLDEQAIAWFMQNGIPSKGSMQAAPVPGAPDLCVTLLRRYGTISFERAALPMLRLLDAGQLDWHPRLAVTVRKMVDAERNAAGTRDERLAAARDRFYTGDIADELEAWYIETGAFLRKRDLAAHRATVEDPVSVNYRGYTVYKCPPWTQGPYLCQTLRLLEGFLLERLGHLSADYIHLVTESLKLGLADRDEYYGDPAFVDVPLDRLLADNYTEKRRALIDMQSASNERRPGDPHLALALHSADGAAGEPTAIPVQDTTTCVVADRWGNVVAATPSCNLLTNVPGPSGVTQGNRIRCLNTTPGHPNCIQPGKRPRITLTPTIVTRDGRPVIAISVAGGDLQDQTTLNVLLNHIDFGMTAAEAVTAPRFSTGHHQNSFDPNADRTKAVVALRSLQINDAVPADVSDELARRGHDIKTTAGPIGNPVMLVIDPATGLIEAAGDPAAKRHAAAIE